MTTLDRPRSTAITPRQLDLLRQSTGWDALSAAKRRALRSMADLPQSGTVAVANSHRWADAIALCEAGLAELSHYIHGGNEAVFHVTEDGFALMLRYLGVAG